MPIAVRLQCPSCGTTNDHLTENCFNCGRGLFAVTKGAVLSGRYEIVRQIGRGGMGIVYKAIDLELKETVAIKVLRMEIAVDEEMTWRFLNEVKLARRVHHPNVCRILELGQHELVRFMSMEFVDGTDFKRIVQGNGPLTPQYACSVIQDACGGLQAIHEAGIFHRDIKTSNLMRDKNYVVRLMDFGIAKQVDGSHSSGGATRTGQIVGTPEYMSPEQVQGDPDLDARSDIYSLGVVFYELLTGDVPFRGDTISATLHLQISDTPRVTSIPGALIPVVNKALAKSKKARYATAKDFAEAIQEASRRLQIDETTKTRVAVTTGASTPTPIPAVAPVPSSPTPPPAPAFAPVDATPETIALFTTASARRRPRVAAITGGLALAGVLGLVTHMIRGRHPSEPSPAATATVALATADAQRSPQPAESAAPRTLESGRAVATLPPLSKATRLGEFEERQPAITVAPFTSEATAPPLVEPSPTSEHVLVEPSAPVVAAGDVTAAAVALPRAAVSSPAPAPAPKEALGTVFVRVRPSAEVEVDGQARGRTEQLALPAGRHRFVFRHPEYKPYAVIVTVQPPASQTLKIDLKDVALRQQ